MKLIIADKIGSATTPADLTDPIMIREAVSVARVGDVVAVRALSESHSYGNLELPTGRLAKINRGDVFLGVLGKRRALKGFVGDIPDSLNAGDRLHLLNMGGVIGVCNGHHSSLSDAIEVEVLGAACRSDGRPINISDHAIRPADSLSQSAPIVLVAGTCMNSGKTVAAAELIRQAANAGLIVAGAKLSGIACLRDTLQMQDYGASATSSFLDCGLPSTVDREDLATVAKAIFNQLNASQPDLIVAELGDGIIGGYSVDSILRDGEIRSAITSVVFCASDYVGVVGGIAVLRDLGLSIDVIAGSVTDSQMGEDFVESTYRIRAGNARRDGQRLFELAVQHEAREFSPPVIREFAFAQ
jgi:hypothetical protein